LAPCVFDRSRVEFDDLQTGCFQSRDQGAVIVTCGLDADPDTRASRSCRARVIAADNTAKPTLSRIRTAIIGELVLVRMLVATGLRLGR